jgi:hypothetical protein
VADGGTTGRDGFFTVLGITAVNSIGNVWSYIVLSVCLLYLGITVARRITKVCHVLLEHSPQVENVESR